MGIAVRKAIEDDIAAIHSIRNYYILHSTATVNTRPREFEETADWVRLNGERFPFLVAEEDGAVIGFGALGPFRLADGYAETAEVSVYIHQAHTGRGAGRLLLRALCLAAPDYGLHCLVAVITALNESSIRLHERHGFTAYGTLPRLAVKFGGYLDVVFMTKLL